MYLGVKIEMGCTRVEGAYSVIDGLGDMISLVERGQIRLNACGMFRGGVLLLGLIVSSAVDSCLSASAT